MNGGLSGAVLDSKPYLSNPKKLAYLRQSLKDSPALHTIKGLLGSGDEYAEAVASLRHCYNRPHLLHREHVRAIMEAPILKNGHGKELCRLHNILSQHRRALKMMTYELS